MDGGRNHQHRNHRNTRNTRNHRNGGGRFITRNTATPVTESNSPVRIEAGAYTLTIRSIAGIETCVVIEDLNLVFDLGICLPTCVQKGNVFISHVHVDHVNAFITHCARRSLFRLPPPIYYVLPQAIPALTSILENCSLLQDNEETFPCSFTPIVVGTKYYIEKNVYVVPFTTVHRIDSVGYYVYRIVRTLREEYRGKTTNELGSLRKRGIDIQEEIHRLEMAYTGDTTAEVFEHQPLLYTVPVLILEVHLYILSINYI